MRKFIIICISFLLVINSNGQDLPLGYIKQFETNLTPQNIKEQIITSRQTGIKLEDNTLTIKHKESNDSTQLPAAICLINNHVLGDFITDVNFQITGSEKDSISGFHIVTGLRDSANFYFINCNSQGASFYKMYRGVISHISTDSNFVIKKKEWQKIRITRNILTRTIELDLKGKTAMFSDPNLIMGFLGLGVRNYTLHIKKMIIWAPTSIEKTAPLLP